MPPKDSDTGLIYEFYSAVVRKGHITGSYYLTVYAIGEFGSNQIRRTGFNTNTETLLEALRRAGFAPTNNDEAVKQILKTKSNYDGLTLIVEHC